MTTTRIAIIAVWLSALIASASTDWTWKVEAGESLELRGPDGPLARLRINPHPADPHFDLLATRDGRNLVWVKPPDHVWHYGQWFSWKFINGVNFWETNKQTGLSDGLTELTDPHVTIAGNKATVTYTRLYRLPNQAPPVLRDHFTITIHAPDDAAGMLGPIIDWSITTTALSKVTLDRTPLPGEPDGQSWGGYAGLSWRGSQQMESVVFRDDQGQPLVEEGQNIVHKQARWIEATGTIEGKPAGVVILDHPENPGHPNTFYIFSLKKLPFWYINPSLVLPKAIELQAGETMTHRYRIIAHGGQVDPDEVPW